MDPKSEVGLWFSFCVRAIACGTRAARRAVRGGRVERGVVYHNYITMGHHMRGAVGDDALKYLAAVYPAAGRGFSPAQATVQYRRMQWFYPGFPVSVSPLLDSSASTGLVSRETHVCTDGYFTKLRRIESTRRFPPMPACAPPPAGNDGACRRQIIELDNEFLHVQPPSHAEVTHLAFNSKVRRRPHAWSQFLDSGDAGWWFTGAPGSGIFYDMGRTLIASFKNMLLHKLLAEYLQSPAASFPEQLHSEVASAAHGNVQGLFNALRSTDCHHPLNTSTGSCRHGLTVPDSYDALLIRLGRSLRYETLYMAASPLTLHGHFVTEIVDLRLPTSRLFRADYRPHTPTMLTHQGDTTSQWTKEQALAWLDEYNATHRLTLRDPLELSRPSLPCQMVAHPPLRLACEGHISVTVQDEADTENLCMRKSAAIGTGATAHPPST